MFSFNDYFRDIFTSLSLKSVTKIHFVILPIDDIDVFGWYSQYPILQPYVRRHVYLFLLQLANGSGRSLTSLHLSRIRKGKPWFPCIHLQTTTRVTKTGCYTSTYHSVTLVMSSVLSSCSWEMLFFSSWTSPSSSFTCDSLVGGNESHLQKWH